jgi:hypothetical protein
MAFLETAVVILSTMVCVLAGMVGYMFWQQTRVLSVVNSLTSYVSTQYEDDRVSVDDKEVEVVDSAPAPEEEPASAPAPAPTDLESKTSAELKDLLTAKGVAFGKRDSKAALLKLF